MSGGARDPANDTIAAAGAAAETPAAAIASPCTNVCKMDREAGWCIGCRRTRDEIAAWRKLDDAGRLAILARLEARWFDDAAAPTGAA
ncbi:DUF1289 domain-containing protein [Burkholderia glumae]|uniref:DUF1289 domain-containing protein n=1 Tax=Burkholderia glumae TaxID=337 RepID=A0AAP9Y0N6_BURGL|nr:DUF1289 domain-containing protein [Burkholderia glumae]ACR30324.1 Hypothetical protein bglu_1g32610 [Burkholderia glumae BGR1]AJY65092.1 hypothetical protein KS03_721 [Burkholderia glumae LMG 2196 = ATCC 33617]MCM2482026.1 DUF1289 domain-containing protein [Burkholderia glumae]MCM2507831.1 DUF1289 domain-containing protein [Burkholderia glumae]MCM2536398.1 DUF1289 domain-containing protein [Burkholderia glumae]